MKLSPLGQMSSSSSVDAAQRTGGSSDFHQRAEQPTQRSSHSLGSIGKRFRKKLGKLLHIGTPSGSRPNASAAASGTITTAAAATPAPAMATPAAPRPASRNSLGAQLVAARQQEKLDGKKPVTQGPANDEPSTSGSAEKEPQASNKPAAKGEQTVTDKKTSPSQSPATTVSEIEEVGDDTGLHGISLQDGKTPEQDEQAVKSALRESRRDGARLQGGDGFGRSINDQLAPTGERPLANEPGPKLSRSNAGRFNHGTELLERTHDPKRPLSLDHEGQLQVGRMDPPALADIVQSKLKTADNSFVALHSESGANSHEHVLLDNKGNLLHLKQSDTATTLLRSSQTSDAHPFLKDFTDAAPQLRNQNGSLGLYGHNTQIGKEILDAPGKAQFSQLTGVHEDHNGQQLRLHDDKLYRFDAATKGWQAHPQLAGQTFSALSTQGDGKTYGLTDQAVVDLSSPEHRRYPATNIKAFSVSREGEAALLQVKDDKQSLGLLDLSTRPATALTASIDVKLADDADVTSIALTKDALLLSDTQGRLYRVGRQQLGGDRSELSLTPEQAITHPDVKLGVTHQAQALIGDDKGQVHALVKDPAGHTHAHPVDTASGSLKAGWNLTDAMVLNNTRGLPGVTPTQSNTFDLGRLGKVGLDNQQVQRWDAATRSWGHTEIKDVSHLSIGLDSRAYMLQNGTLKKLDVSQAPAPQSFGRDYALSQATQTTKVSAGSAIAGLEGRTITGFAMVNPEHFVALDDTGKLTAHHEKGAMTELTTEGLNGSIKSLALDQHSDLFALNDQGEAFQLDKEDWQASEAKPRPEAQWKKIATPDDEPLGSLRTGDDQQLNATLLHGDDKPLARQNNHDWKAVEPSDSKDVLGDLHERLNDGVKTKRIPGTGLTARFAASALGRGGMETQNRVSTKEFITAHVFKPTLEMPRWVKATGDSLVHTAKGRDGLNEVYQAEGKVFKKLEAIADANTPLPAAGEDLKSRIARLDLGPEGKELVEQLEGFRSELENHARKSTVHLGQSKGLLNEHGEFNPPSKRTALSMGLSDVARKLNINSSDHNLMQELQGALKKIGPSEENRTGELLGKLEEKGMNISHQKEEIPLGRRRNPSDDLALTKARLALDVVALKDLSDLVDKIENEQKQAPAQTPPHPSQPAEPPRMRTAQIMEYRDGLLQLRDVQYEEHPVKQVTDMGFRGHASLESTYDGLKAFIKGFSKTDHAISTNLRAATGSTTQKELAGTLKSALKQLDHGDDEINIQRSYGASLSPPFVGLIGKPFGPFPNGSVGGARTYTMGALRDKEGIVVYMSRDGALSGTAGVGAGKDILSEFTHKKSNSIPIGNDRALQPGVRMDAGLSATATSTLSNGLQFKIADEDIDQFVDHMISGKITPMDLMKSGYSHEVQQAKRFNFDVNLTAGVDGRVGVDLSKTGSTPLNAAARVIGGANVSVNLLNYSDYSMKSTSDNATVRESGMNRPRFLNKATASAFLRAQVAGARTIAPPAPAPGSGAKAPLPGAMAIASTPELIGSISVESKTSKMVNFKFEEAQPLKEEDIGKVSDSLKSAFKDKATQKELARLSEQSKAPELAADPAKAIESHLEGLNKHFANKQPENDDQYAALRALTKAGHRHAAAKEHHNQLAGAMFESAYTNLSRLDEKTLLTQLASGLNPNHVMSNAERIGEFMEKDPKLKALIGHLQSTNGTVARVRHELKDKATDTVDIGSRNGTITHGDLTTMLGNRDNTRIQSIMVLHGVTQPESFSTPTPLISAASSSSLTVTKTLGKINFIYGADESTPKGYTLDGDIARTRTSEKQLLKELKDADLHLKS
ncbi:AvrE-family type 3 secretion system effector [Pseudomonas cucumis]|uniref:AvrE-family type 3 secretion system effector n=1 Tax=Pseudomonas cucumis TaxID=2954082 RepID=UPI00273413F1|nr:AvrE-family type 3 secretion system effector [Pseudomonas cucumis]WLG88016.1 AvrE-family type 3 secretion system effector [Pseudomonas cucumis]